MPHSNSLPTPRQLLDVQTSAFCNTVGERYSDKRIMGEWGIFTAFSGTNGKAGGAEHGIAGRQMCTHRGGCGKRWVRGVSEGGAGVARGCLCAEGTPPW